MKALWTTVGGKNFPPFYVFSPFSVVFSAIDGNMVYGPIDGKMAELEYDCRKRLIKAGDITYEYDSENNRIATNTPEYREEYVNNASASLVQVLEINRYKTEDDINDNATKAYEKTVCYYGNGLEYEITNDEVIYHHYNNVGRTFWNLATKLLDDLNNALGR